MTEKQFELKVLKFIKDEKLLSAGDPIVVSVSGGPDSLCLLLLLAKWAKKEQWNLTVAYFDHGLREEAKEEARFVKNWAEKLELPFIQSKGDSLKKKKEGFSTEEAARTLRHSFLKKEAKKMNNAKIAMAHHINDQIETFFIGVLKGAGLGGLSGMAPCLYSVVRPLLCVTKQDILDYLKQKNISFKVDETNVEKIFLRNRVRLELIPFIKNHFPEWNIEKTLPKMMRVFKDEHDFLEKLSQTWKKEQFIMQKEGYVVGIEVFKKLPIALQRRMIKNTLETLGSMRNFSSSHIEETRKLFLNPAGNKKLMLPEGVQVKKFKKAVFFEETL